MVRGAISAARIVGRTASALADLPGQLRHQVSERDLPHERLVREVVAAQGSQPLEILVRNERLCTERANQYVAPLGQHSFGADADRAPVPSHEHTGELHDRDRVFE